MRPTSAPPDIPPPMPTRRPLWAGGSGATNSLATASVILGLLWLGGLGSVAALMLGHKAQRQIYEHWQPGRARATLGIRLGWLGITATAVLAVLVIFTPEQLAYQLRQIEAVVRRLFDGRSAF